MSDDWVVLENTTFSNLSGLDCDDTVDGVCYKDKTLNDCINRTEKMGSGAGYYVKFCNGNNVCVPLSERLFQGNNPVYMLRNQNSSYAKDIKGVNVISFLSKKHVFPPDEGNTMFYGDVFAISLPNGKFVDTYVDASIGNGPVKITSKQVYVSIYSNVWSTDYFVRQVRYGDRINITVPGTSLRMIRDNETSNMMWISSVGDITGGNRDTIVIVSDENKQPGEIVCYGDRIKFEYDGVSTVVPNKTFDFLISKDFEIEDVKYASFIAIPNVKGYYCDGNGECNKINIADTTRSGKISRYKNKNVYRRKFLCSVMCKNTKDKTIIYKLIVFSTIFVVFSIILLVILINVFKR